MLNFMTMFNIWNYKTSNLKPIFFKPHELFNTFQLLHKTVKWYMCANRTNKKQNSFYNNDLSYGKGSMLS